MTVIIDGTNGFTTPALTTPFLNSSGYTVATLPAAGSAGRRAYVTNALLPSYGASVAGGGSVVISVFDNGIIWIVG